KVRCRIDKQNLQVSLYEAQGQKLICEDAAPYYCRRTILKGTDQVKVAKKAPAGEAYFGMGDKTCSANLRGHRVQNWNTDSFSYKKGQDPLYRSIPFYYATHDGVGYGIFFDNSFRTHFDFDSEQNGATSFWADGGEMDYYFLYGPALLDVARRYAWLTGRPELPPLWALGFHQCRWSYYPESRVMELAQEFREREIPCDAIYLDIDYMDGYRCFTWNKAHFPNPAGMIEKLRNQGFQTVVMIDPGIKVDPEYKVYQEGMKHNAFVYRSTGELMRGPVWPPDCVFPDYTRPDVREWWGGLYQGLYLEDGVSGFWNDMNEPAVFNVETKTMPETNIHHADEELGGTGTHARYHNVYGMQMIRATREGVMAVNPDKRPFVLSRANYIGGQRYGATWTGDNSANWEHLDMSVAMTLNLGLSGQPFAGPDIGGFAYNGDGELYARWMGFGTLMPFSRGHTAKGNIDKEPWSFTPEIEATCRRALERRYRLMPYIYTLFHESSVTGMPIARPTFFADPADPALRSEDDSFLLGSDLLVAVKATPEADRMTVRPAPVDGVEWAAFDFESFDGGRDSKDSDLPTLYIRPGAIIATAPVTQYFGDRPDSRDELTLIVHLDANGHAIGELYEDAGEGYGYLTGEYLKTTFEAHKDGEKVKISITSAEGRMEMPERTIKVRVID
ncbi:MAG: DUF5110 domain-containing protein, partial [Phycisphaerales bacterium]|nr:DUF5110 domain-containing protein [Phycisphaerales bacterium]